jgi:hypothetical protein
MRIKAIPALTRGMYTETDDILNSRIPGQQKRVHPPESQDIFFHDYNICSCYVYEERNLPITILPLILGLRKVMLA